MAAYDADGSSDLRGLGWARIVTPKETRKVGEALAVSLINIIEFHLTERPDLDAPDRRHIARAWGVVYINDDGSVLRLVTAILMKTSEEWETGRAYLSIDVSN